MTSQIRLRAHVTLQPRSLLRINRVNERLKIPLKPCEHQAEPRLTDIETETRLE